MSSGLKMLELLLPSNRQSRRAVTTADHCAPVVVSQWCILICISIYVFKRGKEGGDRDIEALSL